MAIHGGIKILRVVIAGAGPAGSSLAIRLARRGHEVTLVERERFPRHKLCGEFISPECLSQFAELGVLDEMLSAGGERIYETRFFEKNGRSFSVPSRLLDDRGFALSLSRSKMDDILFRAARAAGTNVIDNAKITDANVDNERVEAVTVNAGGEISILSADLFIDATGRSMAFSRLIERKLDRAEPAHSSSSLAVGFKAHLSNADIPPGVCEIYFFPGGYGGLTSIEDGLTNLCFLAAPKAAKKLGGDADEMLRNLVSVNRRAAETLQPATRVRDWLAVSVNSFGKRGTIRAENLLAIGDSAAFIDPFTGSGMLMAFESASMLAEVINGPAPLPEIAGRYSSAYAHAFDRRLRVCASLRWAAFRPILPTLAITFLNLSRVSRTYLAGSTRPAGPSDAKSA